MIAEAVKAKYPDIIVCGTVGPFHDPSADYVEGWKYAKENKNIIDMVDEHYYESPGWFLHNQDYYDGYDRTAPKVYLGEWASRGRNVENALVEGSISTVTVSRVLRRAITRRNCGVTTVGTSMSVRLSTCLRLWDTVSVPVS